MLSPKLISEVKQGSGVHLDPDVHARRDVSGALRLHHHRADVVNQDGRPRDALPRLQGPYAVGRGVLPSANLQVKGGCMITPDNLSMCSGQKTRLLPLGSRRSCRL